MDIITAILIVIFRSDAHTFISIIFAATIFGIIFNLLTGIGQGVSIILFIIFAILFTAYLVIKDNDK